MSQRNRNAQQFAEAYKEAVGKRDAKLKETGMEPHSLVKNGAAIAMGVGATGAAVDAFTGEANPFNSGEGLVNVGMGLGVAAAAQIGGVVGGQLAMRGAGRMNGQ